MGLDDLSFFNHLMQAGRRIEPMPDPVYWYRIGETSMKSRNRSAEAGQVRVIAPHLAGLPAEERAYAAYAATCIGNPAGRVTRRMAWILARIWQRTWRWRARWTRWG